MISNIQGTVARFCQVLLTTSSQKVYTAKSDGLSIILDVNACNVGATLKNMSIFINTADDAHCLMHHADIASGSTYRANQMFVVLNKNDSLYAVSNADSVIVLTICGVERV